MTEEDAKFARIEIGVQAFCEHFLSEKAVPHLMALWKAAGKSRKLNLARGDPDTWAAAIAYAFARMNFLLDDDGPLHIKRDDFFQHFEGCNRSTVTQKATRIEKTLNFHYGHPDFCLPEIVDAIPRMVQLPNGMIVPEELVLGETDDSREIAIDFLDENSSKELERQLQKREQVREEEKKRERHEELRQKREEERKTQPDLFDLGD